jgi:hypothetical protein
VADLNHLLDQALAFVSITGPTILVAAVLLVLVARTLDAPTARRSEDDPAPRWRLDR